MTSVFTLPVLADFGIISALIVFAHLIRNRLKVLQNAYIPSAIIAGLLALLLGPQFVNVLPFSLNASGVHNMHSYPSFLVVLLFATLFLGKRKKKASVKAAIEQAGDTFFFNLASIFGQYGFSILLGLVILKPLFPYLPEGFSLLLPAGFAGGHGTASVIGSVLEGYGFEGALSIGYASATIGILVGVLGGMILINIGIRLGWTRIVHSVQQMPRSMRTGFVPEAEQQSVGKETTSPLALDPLTWHMAIVIGTALLAYEVAGILYKFINISVPVFCLALLLGALVQKILNVMKIGAYVDRHLIHRIGSMMTDYLVAFGVASISMHVVLSFAVPLIIMFAFGTMLSLLFVWYLGRHMCRNFWFERSMILFGWNTGTVAISMILVRVLDPDMRTSALEDFGISYFGVAFVEIAIISIVPHLVAQGIIVSPLLILLGGFFSCIFLSRLMIGWFSGSPTAIRPGEAAIMDGHGANNN